MSKKNAKQCLLSEKLSSLILTKPRDIGSDDDNDDFTTEDKIAPQSYDSEYSADELDATKFRQINKKYLAEDDVKYSGKTVSRKDLSDFASDSDNEDNSDFDKHHGSSPSSDNEDDEIGDIENDNEADEEEYDDNEDSEEEKDEENSEPNPEHSKKSFESNEYNLNEQKTDEFNFNRQIFSQAGKDIEKGNAIKTQLHMWDFLLECRMKLQSCLISSNQFPSYKNLNKFKNDSEFLLSTDQTKKSLRHLLRSLLSLQETLLSVNEEFISSVKSQKKTEGTEHDDDNDDDEEISSEVEDESCIDSKKDNKKQSKNNLFESKLKKLKDFSNEISKRHKNFENYRNSTIQKWNDKTRIGHISSKNFSAFEQSVLKQIEHVLMDRQRLITRTQTKRSSYRILGQTAEDEPPAKKQLKEEDEGVDDVCPQRNKTVIDKEIFDDDDFYHQMLSELIKRRASDITDPVQLGRQWMQLQKIRLKMKKNVDTKASKGRKVRFVVHPKLVNFMMPDCSPIINENSRLELINSLFGKKIKS